MTKQIFYLFVTFATVACSRYPADVERALKLAGDNRAELEKVLAHYNQQSEDKLKLRSAYFLIANMPYHFSVHDAQLDSFKSYLSQKEPYEGLLDDYKSIFGSVTGKMEIKPDLLHITSEYLIRNIDFSFHVWQETPWGKNFSFDDFCEEILPYRISNEPLEYWKEEYYAVFRSIIDTMENCVYPEEVSLKLLEHIQSLGWVWETDFDTPGLGASIILEKRYGSCKELTEYVAYMLRSVGIPSGINTIIQAPDKLTQRHFWNYLRDNGGKYLNVDFYWQYYSSRGRDYLRKSGKVYRQYYGLQKESNPIKHKGRYIPPGGLREYLIRDVSSEYFPDTHISVRIEPSASKKDMVYLCVFNNREWIPIACTQQKRGIAQFRYVESDILYQLRLIDQTRDISVSKPFILLGNENARFFDADTSIFQSMTLFRKFRMPYNMPYYVNRAVNGKFQGADQPDFSDAVTLHTIQKASEHNYVDIRVEHSGKYKYVRYLSADGGYNNMAEAQFYSGGQLLSGEVFGTDGSKKVFPNSTKYSVFDGDPLTFFDALEADGAWVGLQFDKSYRIDAIRYIFRNDDNNIHPGDDYELLYQSNGQWLSAGMKTADTIVLQYDKVPSNTLYWLRDLTRGKEERPFTYEEGKQIWW